MSFTITFRTRFDYCIGSPQNKILKDCSWSVHVTNLDLRELWEPRVPIAVAWLLGQQLFAGRNEKKKRPRPQGVFPFKRERVSGKGKARQGRGWLKNNASIKSMDIIDTISELARCLACVAAGRVTKPRYITVWTIPGFSSSATQATQCREFKSLQIFTNINRSIQGLFSNDLGAE